MVFAYYLILVLHVFACLFLIGVVLLQQGKGQDLAAAFGGGGTQAAFGPRGSANLLTRATSILAGVFMLTCIGLALVRPQSASILDQVEAAPTSATSASSPAPTTAPVAPAAPSAAAPAPEQTAKP